MAVACKICGEDAVFTVPTLANGSTDYCGKHIPIVRKADAHKGLYPLVEPVESVPAPKKKAAKAPVEEASVLEESAVESTNEDN